MKTKDVRARLGEGDTLSSVEDTKKIIGARMTPAIRRHVAESKVQFQKRSAKLGEDKQEMTLHHRDARAKLAARQETEWQAETRDRTARLPKGLRGLWHRITGQYQEVRRTNEAEAQRSRDHHALERQNLIEQQLAQRAVLQAEFKKLRKSQAQQLLELRKEVGRYLQFSRGDTGPARTRENSLALRLER
ncbi:hypothetical protein [Rhizobium brockwellii]|uniref:hypothetical protein n=1 Tax=Rhizobium brockwellii TaxID=3019932 RepID=UPI003F97A0AF